MFSPYYSNSCYEPDYECICIVINGKIRSVPLNILNSVVCPPDHGDNPRAFVSGFSYVQPGRPLLKYFISSTSEKILHITSHFVLKMASVL